MRKTMKTCRITDSAMNFCCLFFWLKCPILATDVICFFAHYSVVKL